MMLTILTGDAIEQLRTLPDESVHCCVTSPPYWGLRDYSTNGQLGLEKTPEEYVAKMVEVFREVRRVLRKDGTLWLNLGDSYATSGGQGEEGSSDGKTGRGPRGPRIHAGLKPKDLCGIPWRVAFALQADGWWLRSDIIWAKPNPMPESVTDRPTKAHEYLFLLTKSAKYFYDAEAIKEQASESYRNDGRWESGPTEENEKDGYELAGARNPKRVHAVFNGERKQTVNKRSVWTVATAPYPEAHFATYPPDLIKPCILAGTSARGCCAKCGSPWERIVEVERNPRGDTFGNRDGAFDRGQAGSAYQQIIASKTIGWQSTCECPHDGKTNSAYKKGSNAHRIALLRQAYRERGSEYSDQRQTVGWTETYDCAEEKTIPCTVLDLFAGSGTTGAVALELGRKAILIELNPKYVELIKQRCNVTLGLALA